MSVLRKFAGQTLIYGLSTILARVLNFLLTPLFVKKFPAAVYGVFTNLYSWAALLNNLLAFGMETTFFRFLDKHEGNKRQVFNNSFAVILITSILFVFSVFSFRTQIAQQLMAWLGAVGGSLNDFRSYVLYFAVILAADALAIIPFARLRAEGKALRFSLIKLTNILVVVLFNLLFLVGIPAALDANVLTDQQLGSWYREGWLGYVFISNLIASILTLILLIPQFKQFQFRLDGVMLKAMLLYSVPILIANISFVINELLDKMILMPRLLPAEQAATDIGIYGAVSKLAIFLSIAIQAFRLGAEPFFFSQAKQHNAKGTYAVVMEYFVILVVLAMVGLTVNVELLKYFIKADNPLEQAKYWSGLQIVPVLLLGYVLLGMYTNLSIWYKLSDQTRYAWYISGIGAVVTILLNIWLIPIYSYIGAAWVTVCAYAVMVILSYFWGQRNYPIPYNLKKLLAYLGVGCLISWLAFEILDRDLIWGNLLFVAFLIGTVGTEWKALSARFKQ